MEEMKRQADRWLSANVYQIIIIIIIIIIIKNEKISVTLCENAAVAPYIVKTALPTDSTWIYTVSHKKVHS